MVVALWMMIERERISTKTDLLALAHTHQTLNTQSTQSDLVGGATFGERMETRGKPTYSAPMARVVRQLSSHILKSTLRPRKKLGRLVGGNGKIFDDIFINGDNHMNLPALEALDGIASHTGTIFLGSKKSEKFAPSSTWFWQTKIE